jgi:hypothetical protein
VERYQRHRYALVLPFVALVLVTLIGGMLNGVTARGTIVDDFTNEGVKDAQLSIAQIGTSQRLAWSGEGGAYVFENVPRTTRLRIDAGGFLRASAPPEGGEVRLTPLSITIQVDVEGTDPPERVPQAQVRQETRILGNANASGNTVISPHPGRDAKLIVCRKGFQTKEVVARGVALTVALKADEAGDCPPLPTPTPDPNATPSPSPSPSASPSAAPSPSPSPR